MAFVAHHERDSRSAASRARRRPAGSSGVIRRETDGHHAGGGEAVEQARRSAPAPRALRAPAQRRAHGLPIEGSGQRSSSSSPRRRTRARCGSSCRRCRRRRGARPPPAPGAGFRVPESALRLIRGSQSCVSAGPSPCDPDQRGAATRIAIAARISATSRRTTHQRQHAAVKVEPSKRFHLGWIGLWSGDRRAGPRDSAPGRRRRGPAPRRLRQARQPRPRGCAPARVALRPRNSAASGGASGMAIQQH